MPRTKATADDARAAGMSDTATGSEAVPRKRCVEAAEMQATPAKRRRGLTTHDALLQESSATDVVESEDSDECAGLPTLQTSTRGPPGPATTPRRRGRPPKTVSSQTSTSSKTPARSIFATPTKEHHEADTPKRKAADRSARKKSARALIENVVGDGLDSGDEGADDDVLVRELYEDSDGEDLLDRYQSIGRSTTGSPRNDAAAGDLEGDDATPSKTGPRGGRRAKPVARSPTPPRHLPAHELYFLHNKPGRPQTSDKTLASLAMLTHDEYFSILNGHVDRHANDVAFLEDLHAALFPQWLFELSQGYSLCLYGFGSKRRLVQKFAQHLHARAAAQRQDPPPASSRSNTTIIIVNGYAPTTTLREILTCISAAVDPSLKPPSSSSSFSTATLAGILSHLSRTTLTLTLLINSIDAAPLRKPATQSLLSRLASHPQIHLVCSADTPDFPLLWDIGVRSAFNFLFHDCTTFAPLTAELDVVDQVHELLGRTARRVNGRDGVAFLLRSLPENGKNLFRLLVGEVLVAMEDEAAGGDDAGAGPGVEYRMVYNKAVEEFICSSEMAFRTLLKEFHDHQIITSRKDALGTELLDLPFRRDELEAILEDLLS